MDQNGGTPGWQEAAWVRPSFSPEPHLISQQAPLAARRGIHGAAIEELEAIDLMRPAGGAWCQLQG